MEISVVWPSRHTRRWESRCWCPVEQRIVNLVRLACRLKEGRTGRGLEQREPETTEIEKTQLENRELGKIKNLTGRA